MKQDEEKLNESKGYKCELLKLTNPRTGFEKSFRIFKDSDIGFDNPNLFEYNLVPSVRNKSPITLIASR